MSSTIWDRKNGFAPTRSGRVRKNILKNLKKIDFAPQQIQTFARCSQTRCRIWRILLPNCRPQQSGQYELSTDNLQPEMRLLDPSNWPVTILGHRSPATKQGCRVENDYSFYSPFQKTLNCRNWWSSFRVISLGVWPLFGIWIFTWPNFKGKLLENYTSDLNNSTFFEEGWIRRVKRVVTFHSTTLFGGRWSVTEGGDESVEGVGCPRKGQLMAHVVRLDKPDNLTPWKRVFNDLVGDAEQKNNKFRKKLIFLLFAH